MGFWPSTKKMDLRKVLIDSDYGSQSKNCNRAYTLSRNDEFEIPVLLILSRSDTVAPFFHIYYHFLTMLLFRLAYKSYP